MLVLTRRLGESFYIGDDIFIRVTEIRGGVVRLAFDAPEHIKIYREEIYNRIKLEDEMSRTTKEVDGNE